MAARVLDGKTTAAAIRAELTERVAALRARGVAPGLGTVLVGDDPGSRAYVAGKHRDCAEVGIASIRRDLPAEATQADVEQAVDELNADPTCTGFIVQLPLPRAVDPDAVLERIDPTKDADGLHPTNLGRLVLDVSGRGRAPLPCTPRGIVELLRRYDISLSGAHVVVVGRGTTSGRPLGLLLTRRPENATVTSCHTGTRDLASVVRSGDIVVAAAGQRWADHRRHGAARRGGARRRHEPRRRRQRTQPHRRRRRTGGGRGGGLAGADAGRGGADDARDAAGQRGRGGRAVTVVVTTPRLLGPWLLLLVGVAAAVVAVVAGHLRAGGYLLAGALGVTALVRAVLPTSVVGAVAVRSKVVDVLLLAGAAGAAGVLAATVKLTV